MPKEFPNDVNFRAATARIELPSLTSNFNQRKNKWTAMVTMLIVAVSFIGFFQFLATRATQRVASSDAAELWRLLVKEIP